MSLFTATPNDGAAWVTGASAGIGKEVAIKLAQEGFSVFISARSEEKLEQMAAEFSGKGKLIPLPLDVTDREASLNCVESRTFR